MEPLVSVVTPVYNGEKFIREAIESVIAQEYQNWEYVILNNQSKDNTLEIAREYAKEDQRIKVIDSDEFLPVIGNFNKALNNISAESVYCKFLCADDWLAPDCLKKMVALAELEPSVGIVGSFRLVQDKVMPEGLPYTKTVYSGREMGRMNLLDGPYTFGAPSALLYRREIMRNRENFYNEEHTAADTEACYETLKTWNFGFVHQILTFNRIHEQSVTSSNMYLNRELVNHIFILKQHGDVFLTSEEYQARWKKVLQEYHQFLGGHLMRFLNPEFMAYHRDSMKQLNIPFSWLEIVKGTCFLALRRGVDTKQNLKSLRSMGRRFVSSASNLKSKIGRA